MKLKFLGNILSIAAALVTFSSTAWAQQIDPILPPDVPEIPAASAPFLLMGLLGLVLWGRNFFNKK